MNDANTKKLKGILKNKNNKGYDLILELNSDTNWCEPRDHVIPKRQNMFNMSVTWWKPALRHQHYWNEVDWYNPITFCV
jgi:hypothetical protein